MSHYIKVTNILLVFHVLLNILIGFLGVPATVLYMLDFLIDTDSIGSDNIFITIYLFLMTLIQLFQAYLIIVKTPLKKVVQRCCLFKRTHSKIVRLPLFWRAVIIIITHLSVFGFLIYLLNDYLRNKLGAF